MGVGRVGRTRTRPGFPKKGLDAYRRPQMLKRRSPQTASLKMVGVIVAAIIAAGFVVGLIRTFLFAR